MYYTVTIEDQKNIKTYIYKSKEQANEHFQELRNEGKKPKEGTLEEYPFTQCD